MAKIGVEQLNCKTSLYRNTSKRDPDLTFAGEMARPPFTGTADGKELGLVVGFAEGEAPGPSVAGSGLPVDDLLGTKVVGLGVTGLAEGDALGASVNVELGDDVGLVLGLSVTDFTVGDELGRLIDWKQQVILNQF